MINSRKSAWYGTALSLCTAFNNVWTLDYHAFKVLAKERDPQVSITLTFGVKVATGGGLIILLEETISQFCRVKKLVS